MFADMAKTKVITWHLQPTPEIHRSVKKLAALDSRSLRWMALQLIREALAVRNGKNGKGK